MTPRWMKLLFIVLMCGTFLGWAWKLPRRIQATNQRQQRNKGPAKLGQLAPSFSLQTPNGEKVRLQNYRGKWVLLNFWATWCPPCRREMPSMERLARLFGNQRFVLLAASVDSNWRIVRRFFQKHPKLKNQALKMQLLLDKEATSARRFGTQKFPETYLIAPDGTIRAKFIGEKQWDSNTMRNQLKRLMATNK